MEHIPVNVANDEGAFHRARLGHSAGSGCSKRRDAARKADFHVLCAWYVLAMVLIVCPSCGRHAFASEAQCPHCGLRGRPTLLALSLALGLAAVGCTNPADHVVGVYGPAPVDPSAREAVQTPSPLASGSAAASGSASTQAPSSSELPSTSNSPSQVYGPPPRDPNQRK